MGWIYLLGSALFEIAWAVGIKQTDGFTRLWPTVYTFVAGFVSFVLLAQATRTLPIGTSYAVCAGIATAGTAAFGILWWNESGSGIRLACIVLIIVGVVGLRLYDQGG
jgi:quaternary ammonium compound-resistance protein SugE